MREIGGYLQLETLINKEYYPNAIALNTARNALVYLVEAKCISKIYIPYFLCDSVSSVCEREGIEYEYYHIDEHFLPFFFKELQENEYLYIVNFYGQLNSEVVLGFKEKYKNVILDNVQAFFEAPLSEVDTIYSCRKFFGVPDGAYLVSNANTLELRTDVSRERMRHILGRYEGACASDFYADFQANDNLFDELPLMHMSKLTHNILGAIDYENVIEKRNDNWKVLHEALEERNRLKLRTPYAPYMYPFYCENGMKVRRALAERKIFVPTLWPNVLTSQGGILEKDYAENILPLPLDQRYENDDMYTMITELMKLI